MRMDCLHVRYFQYCLFQRNGYKHAKFLNNHNVFHSIVENYFYQPYNLPADARYIDLEIMWLLRLM